MTYTDPDRDAQITDLRRRLDEAEERYRATHALWRAGLMATQRPGATVADVECALIGADVDPVPHPDVVGGRLADAGLVAVGEHGRSEWATVRTVPGGGAR